MTLTRLDTGSIVFKEASFEKRSNGTYTASFASLIVKYFKLNFVDHVLQFSFESSESCLLDKKIDSSLKLVLYHDYQEKKISFWDVLMGV